MNVLGHIGGVAFVVAAFAFHWRARFLSDQAEGWPAAPRSVRLAVGGLSAVLTCAGFWKATTGWLPEWADTVVALALAAYGVICAFNIGLQRERADS